MGYEETKERLSEMNVAESTASENIDSQELRNTDNKVVEPVHMQNIVENKLLIEDFQTKPLAQSSHAARNKSHNNGASMYYHPRSRHNSYETYPNYDSGVGTISSLDSMFDEFDDANYTSFGDPTETRRT